MRSAARAGRSLEVAHQDVELMRARRTGLAAVVDECLQRVLEYEMGVGTEGADAVGERGGVLRRVAVRNGGLLGTGRVQLVFEVL